VRATLTRYGVPGWGSGELWTAGELVLAHEFSFGAVPSSEDGDSGEPPLVDRFRAFFAGADVKFDDVALDLSWATPFQAAVADALRAVPRGEIVSYGELAALAGHPGAGRAVGTFCAHNRFMLLLPCHRVVGADGIGGYGSAGVGVKQRLLALEGIVV
jgi:methylated-DNA-[protein]-cysteine S-methyltransferase